MAKVEVKKEEEEDEDSSSSDYELQQRVDRSGGQKHQGLFPGLLWLRTEELGVLCRADARR